MNQAKFLIEFLEKDLEIDEDLFENNKLLLKFFNLKGTKNKGLLMIYTIDKYEFNID